MFYVESTMELVERIILSRRLPLQIRSDSKTATAAARSHFVSVSVDFPIDRQTATDMQMGTA